jgi:plastocyanin
MRRPWVALAAGLALLAGCGGSEERKPRAVTLPAGRPLTMAAHEYYFDPGKVTVAKAGELRITLRNQGSLAHDIRLRRGGRDVGGTPAFEGGRRTASVRLTPGSYSFLCTVGDHAELGMKGTLQVR